MIQLARSVRDILKEQEDLERTARELERLGTRERERLGLEVPEGVEYLVNGQISTDHTERRLNAGTAGHYNPMRREIVLGENVDNYPVELVAHEQEHASQAARYPGVEPVEDPENILTETGLIESIEEPFRESELLGDLKMLGYTSEVIAAIVDQNPEMKQKLTDIKESYPDNSKNSKRNHWRKAEALGLEIDTEKIEYAEERLELLMDTYRMLEESCGDGVQRSAEPSIESEKEGFAHYLSAFINPETTYSEKSESLEGHDLYSSVIPGGDETVGDRASQRVEELAAIERNLTEHGGMDQEKAVRYVMTRVQDRKIKYAEKNLPHYETTEDIENALRGGEI